MGDPAIRQPSANQRWPMTGEAWLTLVDELGRLRADVVVLVRASAADDGLVCLRVVRAARRIEALTAVLDAAEQVRGTGRAVIGRRVTLLEHDGESVTYALVCPGEGDAAQGWISADSPVGAAVLDTSPDDVVPIIAPAGRRVVTVISVE